MIRLSRKKIQILAADEAVFQRGLAYFKEKRVLHAACSKDRRLYSFTVQGKQRYHVTIEETKEHDIEFSCNCPVLYMQKGACKHTVAALLYLLQYQEQEDESLQVMMPGDMRVHKVVRYFINAQEPRYNKEVYRVEPCIEIPALLREERDPAYLSLRAGSTKLYRIQGLKHFLMEYKGNGTIALGKEFCYVPGESEFDHASAQLLQELAAYAEVLELADGKNSTKLFQKSKILLSRSLLTRILKLCRDIPFTLRLSGTELDNVRFVQGNPPIEYDIFMQEGSVSMNYKEQEHVVPIAADGSLLLRDNVLYLPEERFRKTYLPFYSTLGDDKAPLVFEDDYENAFLEYVLPVIHETLQVEIPEEVHARYVTLPFSAKVYFDLFHSAVRATVYYVYGEYEFNSFETPALGGIILVREKEREAQLEVLLERYGFEPHNGFYLMKNEEDIYALVTGGLPLLAEQAVLYSSDDFMKMRAKRHTNVQLGIGVSPGEDLLEIEFRYGSVSREELRAVFYSYRQKKKYHRLSDGSFLDLTEDTFVKTADLLEGMNLSYRDFDRNGVLRVPKNFAAYLDFLPQEMGLEVKKDEGFRALAGRLRSPGTQEYAVPDTIRADLREYQKTGFSWLRMLSDNGFGGVLADDMGLGKTLQAITYMASVLKEESFSDVPFLVVCPTSLLYNWLDEVETYAPQFRVRVVQGAPEERRGLLRNTAECDLCITSYPLLRRDLELYRRKRFHTVFIDEAQYIKNAMTGNARSVKELFAKTRFALTGTPIENSLSELWSIFDFIMPGYLFSYTRFARRYERPAMLGHTEQLQQLNHRVRPFLLRRMKEDVLSELSGKIETKLLTDLTEEQRLLYLSYVRQARRDIAGDILRLGTEKSRMQILAALTRLRQICCHPGMFLENYGGGSAKTELFLQIMDELKKSGHRVLVFSQFTSMLEILRDSLTETEFSYFYLNGATKPADRQEYVKRFNAGEGDLFLISLKAGGTGLNLTGADTVIHFDPWWNPAVEEQASDRAHRIGQEKTVHIIRLLTRGTIEEKIFRLQKKKQDLFHAVIEEGETFLNKLTPEEITELFADI